MTRTKESERERIRRYREHNPEKLQEQTRRSNRVRRFVKFGVSEADYARKLAAQGGQCLICSSLPHPHRKLCIDHDHATNKIRALLCVRCNTGLGLFMDDPDLLLAAVSYLSFYTD